MLGLWLAIQCFFAVLFGGTLPEKALPAPVEPEDKKQEREKLAKDLEEIKKTVSDLQGEVAELKKGKDTLQGELEEAKAASSKVGELTSQVTTLETKLEGAAKEREEAKEKLGAARNDGVLAVLGWLQREGRLIDFLRENIDDYEDEQVGAAVRAIHKGCRKVLDEGLDLEAILDGEEETSVEVPKGFDPVAIQLTGNVKGDPPFKGTLMHHGWRTKTVSVPVPETVDPRVLAPAEVEL